jgi:hypothetical protein
MVPIFFELPPLLPRLLYELFLSMRLLPLSPLKVSGALIIEKNCLHKNCGFFIVGFSPISAEILRELTDVRTLGIDDPMLPY